MDRYDKNGTYLGNVGRMDAGTACFEMSSDQAYIYGSNMTLAKGQNFIQRLHLGSGVKTLVVTNNIAQARCLSFGADGLLYAASRSNGDASGVDYNGGTITPGMYRGVQAFDVSNGNGPILKHYYKAPNSTGGCVADTVNNRIYSFSDSTSYIFGRSEFAPDGETTGSFLAAPAIPVVSGNFFSGALIAGRPYTGSYAFGKVFRYNADNTATLVATITNSVKVPADSTVMKQIHGLREDVFPENDTTLALTRLSDYWSFNEAGSMPYASQVNPARSAGYLSGFTSVQGAVREGLWCGAGANGRLTSAMLWPQTNDCSLAFFCGFPEALTGTQQLFSTPKMTIAVTAGGCVTLAMTDGTVVTGTTSIADGAWHHVALVRRNYAFEIWVDGVLDATSTPTECTIYDDTNTQWSLLSATNPNKMFLDEVRFYYSAALAQYDVSLLKSLATDGLKVPSGPASYVHAAAEAMGSVVAHAPAHEHSWGVPAIVTDANGTTLYVASDFARPAGQNNQSVIWKSTDKGDTWTRVGSDASLGAMALFRFDADVEGTVRAGGLSGDRNLPWGVTTTDGGVSWSSPYLQSSTPLEGTWYPTQAVSAKDRRSVSATRGIFGLNVVKSGEGGLAPWSNTITNSKGYAASFKPGGIMALAECPAGLVGRTTVKHASATNAISHETVAVAYREGTLTGDTTYRGVAAFPGASRPFGVTWDATTKRYWAAVSYVKAGEATNVTAQANRLALYCASNAVSWTYCGEILAAGTPTTVGINNPNVSICGNDLVVVFGASVRDVQGADAPRDVTTSNYILSKRVANFRSLQPTPTYYRSLLVLDQNRILRLCEDEETGEWKPCGYFGDGSYTDQKYSLSGALDVAYAGGRVWILANGRFFAFTPDGAFTGTCIDLTLDKTTVPKIPEAFGCSFDERYIYSIYGFANISPADTNFIYRTDIATGTTIQFCSSLDAQLTTRLYKVRAAEGLPDGSVALTSRDGKLLFRLNADGTFKEDIWTNVTEGQPQALHYDRRDGNLYVSGFNGKLCRWNYYSGEKSSKVCGGNVISITGDNQGRIFGTTYDLPAGAADLLADGGAFTQTGHCEILQGGATFFRCCYFDARPPQGTILFFR